MNKIEKSRDEWRSRLSPEQYRVTREKGTEPAFSGKYWDNHGDGEYRCSSCGLPLFTSETKFESGTGWPSFYRPISKENIDELPDRTHGMLRTEVLCARCSAHLGHVFDDGPQPTGLRYCINSAALSYAGTEQPSVSADLQIATFAAGCFWGVEEAFAKVRGVVATAVGYTGGSIPDPTYEQVCTGRTGHAEATQVSFDPAVISYEGLLDVFWKIHDPTQKNRQGPDIGTQYRSAIFFHTPEQEKVADESRDRLEKERRFGKPIATEIVRMKEFWKAEEYHQRYFEKHPEYSCHVSL